MFKIVLDTNQYISSFLYHGMSRTIFDLITNDKLSLYFSPDLEQEVLHVFKRAGADKKSLAEVSVFFSSNGIGLSPTVTITACRDPKDNFLLELAETAKADYLITRDKDLLELPTRKWKGTKIVKPEEFMVLLRKESLL